MASRHGQSTVQVLVLAGALLAVPLAARADDCAAVTTASIAQAKRPYAGTMAITHPGKPADSGATIITGTKVYAQLNGTWHAGPYVVQDEVDRINKVSKDSQQSCAKIGAEALGGEAATIYTAHSQSRGGGIDTRVWISDRSGLPLKTESHFPDGTAVVATYRYDNIQAPAGVE